MPTNCCLRYVSRTSPYDKFSSSGEIRTVQPHSKVIKWRTDGALLDEGKEEMAFAALNVILHFQMGTCIPLLATGHGLDLCIKSSPERIFCFVTSAGHLLGLNPLIDITYFPILLFKI